MFHPTAPAPFSSFAWYVTRALTDMKFGDPTEPAWEIDFWHAGERLMTKRSDAVPQVGDRWFSLIVVAVTVTGYGIVDVDVEHP